MAGRELNPADEPIRSVDRLPARPAVAGRPPKGRRPPREVPGGAKRSGAALTGCRSGSAVLAEWPPHHDQRHRVLVRRLHVDEVDVNPVDLGRELRDRIQFRLALAPVVIGCPVAGELLDHRRLHALRPIGDEIRRRPARHGDTPLKVGDFFAGHVDPEWPCC
jgi:hypothetical protein